MPGNQKTIIIAEDDPFISRMYEIKLSAAGYRALVKNNGRDAYEGIKNEHPVLVLLDLNMPELSGMEVLQALKADDFDFVATPIVVLTNSSKDEDRKLATSFGADYIVKAELTPKQVLEVIDKKLKEKETAPE